MKKIALLTLVIHLVLASYGQKVDSVQNRVFLIGDAGDMKGRANHPVIDWLRKQVDWNDEKNSIVFLGDNIYPEGLPMEGEAGYAQSKAVLDYQLSLVKGKKSRAFLVPGNHDWKGGKLGGWQRAVNQHNYINGLGEINIQSLPENGCPGPIAVEVSDKVVVVFIDSQWFLYVHEKPGPGSACTSRTLDEFATQLNEIVAAHPNQLMIVAMHHPLYTFGPHGKYYTWKEHLFPFTALKPNLYIPLPVIGSIYPIMRGVFGSLQDVSHPLYQNMINIIEDAMRKHPNAIHAAGHEHTLQFIMKDSLPFIVSGAGTYTGRVQLNRIGTLLFSDVSHTGFAMIEVKKSGNAEVRFYHTGNNDLTTPVFKHTLKKIDTLPLVAVADTIPVFNDSVTIAANKELKETFFRNLFMGKNYRPEWTTRIKVPVLNMGKEMGGLTPERQGGGKQTKSLRVEDASGKEWVLRSVAKFPEAAVPPDLRRTIVKDLVEDGISASYPFAALSIPAMANAVGVPTLRRKLVYIPDDPRLGRFRATFRNTLATLEEREPAGIDKTYNTEEMVLRLAKDNDDHVDQLEVLRARLLDNFFMDFDRHEDQWRWGTQDTGKGKLYYPIPKDHDQAFYINQGIIPYFIRKPWLVPELQGFKPNTDNIKTFNKPARNFDRFFLTGLDAETWSRQIDTLLMKMTDSVIIAAMNLQPVEVRNLHARDIINKLKERRKYFKKDLMEYYEFISKEVNVVGSGQRELFSVNKQSDGKVHVLVQKITKEETLGTHMFERTFDPAVTKEIRLYALQDADSFVIKGGNSPIKIRIIGGPGEDAFVNEGTGGNVLVYDVSFEENTFSGNEQGIRKIVTADPMVNNYNRLEFKYGYFHPSLSFAYNPDDGLFIGVKAEAITQGFRKEPYAMRQFFSANKALRTSSYSFKYEADFIKPIGNSDLLIRADVRAPINVTNFFGLGNNSVYDKSNPQEDRYYRARYNTANVSVLLRRQLQSWMNFNFGPTVQYYHLEQDQNLDKFITNTTLNGLDPATLYNRRWYAGAEALLRLNSRNNQALPTRGFKMDAGVKSLFGLNSYSSNITQVHWDMSVVASLRPTSRAVYAVRMGGGKNYGKFEFPQAQYLGGTENLRGYRRNRFAGRSMFYQNTEIRFRVADFNTYLFPGSFGILFFNDVGRVWMRDEDSRRWHHGYGAGLWVSPIRRVVVAASVARSREEKAMPYITIGFQF